MRVCDVGDCSLPHLAKGFCRRHYERQKKTGDPEGLKVASRFMTGEQRLIHHGWTVTDSGCWEWNGSRTHPDNPRRSYGRLTVSRKAIPAHRVAYETWVGEIPEGHVVRHKCDNPPCINPEHLETGTHQQNAVDREKRSNPRRLTGEKNPGSKLTLSEVEDIRWICGMGAALGPVAEAFGVGKTAIFHIYKRNTWRNT